MARIDTTTSSLLSYRQAVSAAVWNALRRQARSVPPLSRFVGYVQFQHTGELRVHAKANQITVSTVYTFAMPKYVYVHFHGIDQPAKIEADKVEREKDPESNTAGAYRLKVSLKDQPVGEFNGLHVDGWWIQDESSGNER